MMDEMTGEQLRALPPLDAAIVVASNLSADRPWEVEQRRLDLLGYLREARFDVAVALPEAQERFQRAEAEVNRLRGMSVELTEALRALADHDDSRIAAHAARLIKLLEAGDNG